MDLTHVSETVLPTEAPSIASENTDREPSATVATLEPVVATGTQNGAENQSSTKPECQEGQNGEPAQPPMTKSQLKKQAKRLKRQQLWDERKKDKKRLRKEKRHEQVARRQAERAQKIAEAEAAGLDPEVVLENERAAARRDRRPVPVTFILDLDFEQFMSDKEHISLSSQLIRSYSENRAGLFPAHLFFSSWKGKMKERFETVLNSHHLGWKGTYFIEGDFVDAGKQALEFMRGPRGGELNDILRPAATTETNAPEDGNGATADPVAEPLTGDASLVYLTSDSPYTLDRLEPYTSYVIGGLVDRNREKGLCFRRARECGVRTAKLPIGDYMVMASRKVLTTNQVVEIMSKWLETGDWEAAFQHAIPKRKGGVLKGAKSSSDDGDVGSKGEDEEEEEGDGEDGDDDPGVAEGEADVDME